MEPSHQNLLDLLELQKLDLQIDVLENRLRALPEQEQLDVLEQRLSDLQKRLGEQQTILGAVVQRQTKLEDDIEQIEVKIKADDQRLYSGDVANPKELAALQAEIESLKRRRMTLEDADLEVMEEREIAEKELAVLISEEASLTGEIDEVSRKRDAASGEIGVRLSELRIEREKWVPKIEQGLLAVYDDLRAAKGGIGAAALVSGTCQGCHMQLPAQEVERIKKATGLVKCDECRRILVVN